VAITTLASLVVFSAFDLALYDAVGQLLDRTVFSLFDKETLPDRLESFVDASAAPKELQSRLISDYLLPKRKDTLLVWHLIGGLDPLTKDDPIGTQPNDGVPVFLDDWIRTDGLKALKVKLRGTDAAWDYERLVRVGKMAEEHDVDWLSADFNCCVHEPAYVTDILDRLRVDAPRAYGRLLYVEQPFPYELDEHPIPAASITSRKPLFLDESAHDWRVVEAGRQLGWNGVALKTCKTLTGALLSAAWAQANGMTLMVQDLTNPMLAMMSHCQLAAHLPTIAGIECNAMQFYPAASAPEAAVHPGIFQRRNGHLDLTTLRGPGFGYRIHEIERTLPAPILSL
jgi:L-alanine-DL-glutamate epimerase-like enolase superfamily enzyme